MTVNRHEAPNSTIKRRRKKGLSDNAQRAGSAGEGSDIERLRQENEALRKELAAVLANASENEKIWRHFAAVERILFRTRELERLIEELLREIKERFQTGLLVLYLSHPEALERYFQGDDGSSHETWPGAWISPLDGEAGRALFGLTLKPVLFSTERNGCPQMFSDWVPDPTLRRADPPKDW